jgi:hypothetical protein
MFYCDNYGHTTLLILFLVLFRFRNIQFVFIGDFIQLSMHCELFSVYSRIWIANVTTAEYLFLQYSLSKLPASSCETFLSTYKSTRRHSPEQHRHIRRRENLKSHVKGFSKSVKSTVGNQIW